MFPFKNKIVKIEGWLTFLEGEILYNFAKMIPKSQCIVEIGSWKGRSTICLGYGVNDGNKPLVYAIDPHSGSSEHIEMFGQVDTYSEFLANLKEFGVFDYTVPLKMVSDNALDEVRDNIGLLFIDGAHEYKNVSSDYNKWLPKVVVGGTIIFHDSWHFISPNLVSAFHLLFSNEICKPKLVDSMTIVTKTSRATILQRLSNILFVIYRTIFGAKFILSKARWESNNTSPSFYS